jgi:hypothetical protein
MIDVLSIVLLCVPLHVLCVAKDMTSVDIICRGFSCIFLRESR